MTFSEQFLRECIGIAWQTVRGDADAMERLTAHRSLGVSSQTRPFVEFRLTQSGEVFGICSGWEVQVDNDPTLTQIYEVRNDL